MINLLKKFKPDYVWVCVGSPKQDILANQLFSKFKSNYITMGAAIDFLLEKKKEAPALFRALALEWLFRLVTDYRTTNKKVWRSLMALKYLNRIEAKH